MNPALVCTPERTSTLSLCLPHTPEGADKLSEGGSAGRLIGPAAGEQSVDGRGALLRFRKANSRLQLVNHLTVLQPEEGLLGQRENLPDAHAYDNTNNNTVTAMQNLAAQFTH